MHPERLAEVVDQECLAVWEVLADQAAQEHREAWVHRARAEALEVWELQERTDCQGRLEGQGQQERPAILERLGRAEQQAQQRLSLVQLVPLEPSGAPGALGRQARTDHLVRREV